MPFFDRSVDTTPQQQHHPSDPAADISIMASSHNGAATEASSKYFDEPEVDYDENPSKLYKLIEGRDWDGAICRMRETPLESSTWVRRNEFHDGTKLRWRLLPIHATCIFKAPVAVIETMIREFPDGSQMKDDQEMLPVHLACRNGASKGVVLLLLESFPEAVNIKDRKGRTPIMLVENSKSQNREVVMQAMKKFMSDRDETKNGSPARKKKEIVPASAHSTVPQAEVDYEHRTVLFRLILKKDWDGASLRCKTSSDEAYTWIVTKGFKGNLRFLPLHKACVLQPPESLIEALTASYPEGPASKDQDGWLPIHCACFYGAGHGVVNTLLVAYPKGAQSKDDDGRLPVHYACLKGASVEVVKSLLELYSKGAQSKDDEGRLPIHHACSKGAPEDVINALLNASPKGSASKDDQGRLPLHHACRKNVNEKVIKALLRSYPKGAQVKDDQDKLPIHYACTNGASPDVIQVLLAVFPHSINAKNGFGYTPLAEAKAMDSPKMEGIISVLEKFKSDNPHLEVDPKSDQTDVEQENHALKAKVDDLTSRIFSLEGLVGNLAQLGTDLKGTIVGAQKKGDVSDDHSSMDEIVSKTGEALASLKEAEQSRN